MTAIERQVEREAAGAPVVSTTTPETTTVDANPRREIWKRFRRNRLALVGLVIIALLLILAVFAPLWVRLESSIGGIAKLDPEIGTSPDRLEPSADHWFGTDYLGRDLFARIVYGARISLLVGFASVIIGSSVGVVLGAIAGYYGRWLDSVIMRIVDIALSLPYIVLAVALVVVFGRSLYTIVFVIASLGWMGVARIFRSSIIQQKNQEYIEASRSIGCSDWRIITRHLVPNSVQPVIVYSTLAIGTAILSEAALSFIGVGALEPTPSWGLMIQAGGVSALRSDPHTVFFPGLFLALTIVSFTAVGDGLRDALDPKLKR